MPNWLFNGVDIALALFLVYVTLFVIEERRTLWVVRGFLVLLILEKIALIAGLTYVQDLLGQLVIISAVAIAIIFQSQLRRLLEQIGRGDFFALLRPSPVRVIATEDSLLDSIVEAVKSLSQNRTGALIVIETTTPMDDKDFSVPGVILNAEISKELLQTIFQTSTLLHDGAVFISGSRIVAAGVILPLSEKNASRQLGTRHRAAMGITERVEHCVCVVVSEETGSISLAERGMLNRPLTSSKLKELLAEYFAPSENDSGTPDLGKLSRQLGFQGKVLLRRFLQRPSSTTDKD